MLSLFTKRQSNLGFILILLSLFSLQLFSSIYPVDFEIWENSAPLAQNLYKFLGAELITNNFFDYISSSILILLQLLLIYDLLNKIKNLEKYSVLITWLYCWLLHVFPFWSKLSPPLIALTIIIFILHRIYSAIDKSSNNFVFTASTLIGISFLIWYPSILLLGFFMIALFQYNVISIKRVFILILSFSIPIIWLVSYHFLIGQQVYLGFQFSNFHLSNLKFHQFTWYQYVVQSGLLFLSILGLLEALNLSTKTAKMSRLFIQSLFSFLIFLLLGLLISSNDFTFSILPLLFPVALLLALFINIFKRQRIAELVHFTILLCVMVNFITLFLTRS